MGLAFFDANHTVAKLHNTICKYRGEPYRVVCAEDVSENNVLLYSLTSSDTTPISVKYTEDTFDYRAFSLGYLFYENKTIYLTRRPGRTTSQGLSRNSLSCAIPQSVFLSKRMYDCIMGTHKTFDEALSLLQTNHELSGIPFHRNGALIRKSKYSIEIHYKGFCIARVSRGGSIIQEENGDQVFLQRILRSIGIN